MKEEAVLASNGFRDIMHDFVDKSVHTMLARKASNRTYKAWRPDKIVM